MRLLETSFCPLSTRSDSDLSTYPRTVLCGRKDAHRSSVFEDLARALLQHNFTSHLIQNPKVNTLYFSKKLKFGVTYVL